MIDCAPLPAKKVPHLIIFQDPLSLCSSYLSTSHDPPTCKSDFGVPPIVSQTLHGSLKPQTIFLNTSLDNKIINQDLAVSSADHERGKKKTPKNQADSSITISVT